MTQFANAGRAALTTWKAKSNRVFKVNDNRRNSIECQWQNEAGEMGYTHISIFCSMGEFNSHITDLLRDNRYDKYEFEQSDDVDEVLFRYYSRILLITSEILTDFQDLFILADNKFTTKVMNGLKGKQKGECQDNARKALASDTEQICLILDFINKICKHKTSNLHICNHHIKYLFDDFHKNIKRYKNRVQLGSINNFTSYDPKTFRKYAKAEYIVVPSLEFIIDIIINCYSVIDQLFRDDPSKFQFICEHYDDKS